MKNLKKALSLVLVLVMITGIFAACDKKVKFETNADGSVKQVNTAIVSYYASGYGKDWLEKAAEVFNEMYKSEGYEVEIEYAKSADTAGLEIGKGGEKNDVDLYLNVNDIEGILDASKKTMRDGGSVLYDLTEAVWNKPAINAQKQEEAKTIKERYLLDEEYLYYYGAREEFHGGIYAMPLSVGSCGIIVNPSVVEKYGYTVDTLPRTTDEFNAMCAKIAETSKQTGVYAYSWPGANAAGYITYLFFEYFAQYSGKEAFMNFVKTKPSSDATIEDIRENGWKVYEDKGILEGFKAMEPIMKPEFSPPGSISMDHLTAQDKLLTDQVAFMMNGDWLLNEMEELSDEYYATASQCIMMNTPVLSVIGTECGITDAELSNAVKMIDEGKSNAEIIAAISKLDEAKVQRIRDARNIYGCGEKSVQAGAAIPAYANGRDVAVLFLRFLCSEDGCQIVRDEAYNVAAFECASYASKGNTAYMNSVIKNINPGQGEYISMDASLSIVRANAGMLYFNHPSNVQPQTFANMIKDTTGEMTAEKMYENEKAYAKSQWSVWAAYIDKK